MILRPNSFVTGYNQWLSAYAKTWGEKNDIQVIVEQATWDAVIKRQEVEATEQEGHDLMYFFTPPFNYQNQLIDHQDIYMECERRYGKAHDFVTKSAYDRKTQKLTAIPTEWGCLTVIHRKDLWDMIGIIPDNWEAIWKGGRQLKLLHEHPVGIGLGQTADAEDTLRAILWSFGASIQTADNQPALKSAATLEAIRFVKTLYEQSMIEEVLNWDSMSNNRFMLSGEGSLTANTISIIRAAETDRFPVGTNLWPAKMPQGPAQRLGVSFINFFGIWKLPKTLMQLSSF